jgi:hypothetical protein
MLDMDCIAQSNEDILRITFETKIFYHEANSFGKYRYSYKNRPQMKSYFNIKNLFIFAATVPYRTLLK